MATRWLAPEHIMMSERARLKGHVLQESISMNCVMSRRGKSPETERKKRVAARGWVGRGQGVIIMGMEPLSGKMRCSKVDCGGSCTTLVNILKMTKMYSYLNGRTINK